MHAIFDMACGKQVLRFRKKYFYKFCERFQAEQFKDEIDYDVT